MHAAASSASPKVSVIVRTFNEAKHIGRLLHDIFAQQISVPIEVIVVDSGSTDATLEIVSRYPTHVIQVSAEQFTFGLSLNRGIRAAKGEICVIVSAHCYPTDMDWLERLIAPFSRNPKIALVYGRQCGYVNTRYSEHQIFAKWFPEVSNDDCGLAFCNNANSAVRREVWTEVSFDESLPGLEDIAWGKAVMAKGYHIAYCAEACVHHIHEETAQQIYRRYYREAMAYKAIFRDHQFSFFSFLKFFVMNSVGDYYHALLDGKLLGNLIDIPLFRFLQFWATYRAHAYREPMSKEMKRRLYYPRRPQFLKESANQEGALHRPTFIDISRPISEGVAVWPGDSHVSITQAKTIPEHGVQVSNLSLCVHTATHMDAPAHFVSGGGLVHEVAIEQMIGDAYVIEYPGKGPIEPSFFQSLNLPSTVTRLLLKTTNSHHHPTDRAFDPAFVAISPASARWLAERHIKLVGIDGPSIQAYDDPDNTTHEILLHAGIVILEGLNLKEAAAGRYHLIALPLHILNVEGAPVRAVLTKEISH